MIDPIRYSISCWLKDGLRPVLQRGLVLEASGVFGDQAHFTIKPNKRYTDTDAHLEGSLQLCADHAVVHCWKLGLMAKVLYSDPQLFEHLERHLLAIYNGVVHKSPPANQRSYSRDIAHIGSNSFTDNY